MGQCKFPFLWIWHSSSKKQQQRPGLNVHNIIFLSEDTRKKKRKRSSRWCAVRLWSVQSPWINKRYHMMFCRSGSLTTSKGLPWVIKSPLRLCVLQWFLLTPCKLVADSLNSTLETNETRKEEGGDIGAECIKQHPTWPGGMAVLRLTEVLDNFLRVQEEVVRVIASELYIARFVKCQSPLSLIVSAHNETCTIVVHMWTSNDSTIEELECLLSVITLKGDQNPC